MTMNMNPLAQQIDAAQEVLNPFAQQIDAAQEVLKDMTEVQKGGGGKLWPEGWALVRLVEYVELGDRAVEFNGEMKAPSPHFYLGFQMYNAGYRFDDGKPGRINTFDLSQSTNEKAKAFKLFKRMNIKGTAKSFANLLGETFMVQVKHYKGKAADAKPRAILDLDTFTAAIDPMSKQPYPCEAAPMEAYKLFLWNFPTKEQWESLFIEGTTDKGDSKNWLQNKIMEAKNFPSSPLEMMLFGSAMPAMVAPVAAPSAPLVDDCPFEADVPAAPAAPATPAAPAMPAAVPSTPAMPSIPSIPKL